MLQRYKGCNIVYINCKCVKEALLHRTCSALQSGDGEHQYTTIASHQSTIRLSTM